MVTIRPLSRSLCRPLSRALVWLNDQARAYLLVDPAGADNSVLYMAKAAGAAGELVSVAYASPATQATTTVAVSTNAITVTPGTKARMIVTGDLTSDGTTPVVIPPLLYAGLYAGSPAWSDTGLLTAGSVFLYNLSWAWGLSVMTNVGERIWHSVEGSGVGSAFPTTGWNYTFQAGDHDGIPVFATGVSSAAQVIAAVNAGVQTLVTASASGASTGPVAEVAAAFLTLIPANALTLDGEVLTLDGQILTLD